MNDNILGNTGLRVPCRRLGAMTFGEDQGVYEHIGMINQTGADAMVKRAIEAGAKRS